MKGKLFALMSYFKRQASILSFFYVFLCFIILSSATTAATLEISAEYDARNSATSLNKNTFTNTTPISGFCASHPTHCKEDEFSITIPGLTAIKYFDALSDNIVDNHVSITIDGTPREIMLRNKVTGKEIPAVFRISLFAMQHNSLDPFTGYMFSVMNGIGIYPGGGCSGRIGTSVGIKGYRHGWGIPENVLTCYKKLNLTDPVYQADVLIDTISIGYTLTLPNPMDILSGDFESELYYSIGPGGNIDFHAHSYSDNDITIKISAKVRHFFKLELAPGSENVSLAPKGGWAQWTNGGRVPQELSQEVPFGVTASTKFKVNMLCGVVQNDGCGLQNSVTNDVVPMNVSITMPGFQSDTGGEITNTLLSTRSNGHVIAPKSVMIVDRRSRIKFSVPQTGVREMVQSPGSTWRGTVTLLFDTEVE